MPNHSYDMSERLWTGMNGLSSATGIPRTDNPAFLTTVGAELPWESEAIFTKVLMHETVDKSLFHKIDLFHTITLGVGKSFASSSLSILQELCEGSSIEERLKDMTASYLEFCKESKFYLVDFFQPSGRLVVDFPYHMLHMFKQKNTNIRNIFCKPVLHRYDMHD